MATVYTHSVVGVALARVFTARRMPPLFWVLAGFLSAVPDFDVFSTSPYGSIAVADIGFEFPDPRTSRAVRTELLYVILPAAILVGIVTMFRLLRHPPTGGAPTPPATGQSAPASDPQSSAADG